MASSLDPTPTMARSLSPSPMSWSNELEKTTASYVASVDELLKHKEAELLEV